MRAARPSLKEQPLRLNDVLIMCTAGRPWWHSQDRASATRPSGCSTAHADTRHRAHAGSHMVARTDLALWPVSAFHVALAASPLAELALWHCSRRAPYGHLIARARTVTSQGGKGKKCLEVSRKQFQIRRPNANRVTLPRRWHPSSPLPSAAAVQVSGATGRIGRNLLPAAVAATTCSPAAATRGDARETCASRSRPSRIPESLALRDTKDFTISLTFILQLFLWSFSKGTIIITVASQKER